MGKTKYLKANAAEKRLYDLAKKAQELINSVLQYKYHGGHQSHIAFDCKVRSRIGHDDLKDILRKSSLTFGQKKIALETFDDSRLENLYYHTLENEAESFKDFLGGEHTATRKSIERNMDEYSAPINCPYPALRDILAKKKTQANREKAVLEFFNPDFITQDHLSYLNSKDASRYGRGGGHFAVAYAWGFDDYQMNIETFIEEAFSVSNDCLEISMDENMTRGEWVDEVEQSYECGKDTLEHIIGLCEAVMFAIGEGEDIVKCLNDGDYFRDRLIDEISSEVGDFTIATDEALVAQWAAHKTKFRSTAASFSFLRLSKDKMNIETSQGISLPVTEAIELFNQLKTLDPAKTNTERLKIGNYSITQFGTVPNFSEPVLIAGCHKIQWDFIQQFVTKIAA